VFAATWNQVLFEPLKTAYFVTLEFTEEFIRQIAQRDRRSILLLYEYAYPFMLRRLSRLSLHKEEQMSIVNVAFLKAIERIETFDRNKDFPAWIRTIVKNEFIDQYRKKQKDNKLFKDIDFEKEFQASDISDLILQGEDATKLLFSLVDSLPESTRIVFNLFVIEDMSREEIAVALGLNYDTVKWHILKARKIIAVQLEKTTL
jgi:RNA polymerase sigma-70 factor (ECF subfamily)